MPSIIDSSRRFIAKADEILNEDGYFYYVSNDIRYTYSIGIFSVVDAVPDKPGFAYWNGEKFVESLAPKPEVPSVVSMRQAKVALVMSEPINAVGSNALESITQTIDALPEPDRTVAKITWEYAVDVERSNELISKICEILKMTQDQIDELFIKAASY